MNHRTEILDLRTALAVLRETPGQLIETSVEVDPAAELSGVYRYVGAGGTVRRPTRVDGPAMLFHNVKGHPGASVAIGVLSSRRRVADLFGCEKEELGRLVQSCAAHPIQPVVTDAPAPCQEVVHLAADPDFDLFRLVPAPTNTPVDAGPYITLGMCYATHPDTGLSDVTIHRMCLQGRDELSIFLQPGSRHIGAMADRAAELDRPLPISISIGVDPAIEVTSCFEPPTTPLGFNELSIAGALRQRPVELTRCVSIPENAIANAEYVIEGEIVPGVKVVEDRNSHTGYAMPEFPGYNGPASHECRLVKVKAVTHRRQPIMQTCIGPSEEHVNMAG
ncbi:MAG: UbiD family decarboxylase domain-containing protein, partial [Oscillospiraceae bacterium]